MNSAVGGCTTVCVTDHVVVAPGKTSLPIPSGFEATDLNGKPLSSIPVGPSGNVIIEVKTGNGGQTANQKIVYQQADAGNAVGKGKNAGVVKMGGTIPATPVVILRKRT